MVQNISHAVMAQRHEGKDSLDDFPTPPWATRALLEYVIKNENISKMSCLEPACNRGYMSKVLDEYFSKVESSDIHDYGFGNVKNFLDDTYEKKSFDWVITNPPFRLAEEFLNKATGVATTGVALLARTVFLESVGRYERIFQNNPPACFAQFTERVPMVKGRLDKKASTATGYAWFVWKLNEKQNLKLMWVPPCRKILEKDEDYDKTSDLKKNKLTNHKDFIQRNLCDGLI
ncbi:MAG: SAM-dependent methyltransferase [Alphaproteobacteria bacterium]|nr:SAM-dependent methyltransferase [Alphaproteobacteria bacterium]